MKANPPIAAEPGASAVSARVRHRIVVVGGGTPSLEPGAAARRR